MKRIEIVPDLVFVLMAIRPEMDLIFEGIEDVGHSFDLDIQRIIDIPGDYKITDKILELIEKAALIIADLSYERPNVYFELGYARGKNKKIITIAKKETELHFDIKGWRCLFYIDSRDIEKQLKKEFEYIFPNRHQIRPLKNKVNVISKEKLKNQTIKKTTLAEMIIQSNAKSYNDQVLVAAFYLLKNDIDTFTVSMILEEFYKARLKKPANMADVINKLIKKGFLQEKGKIDKNKAYQITLSGERKAEELISSTLQRE